MGDVPSIPTNEKRQRMYAAVLDAVAQGRQSLSLEAAKHIAAEIARLTAERDEAIARADLLTGALRMCVNCGKTRSSSEPKDGLPACSHPDYPGMAACTWDATPQEAWEHWRKITYDERTRAETAEAQVKRLAKAGAPILLALQGPYYLIREIQAIRRLPGDGYNPIRDFEAALAATGAGE